MPVRIATEKAMQRAAKAAQFCYLCGESLLDAPKGEVATEHVFPRAILSEYVIGSGRWPVSLRVHRRCDQQHKAGSDACLVAVQRAHTRHPSAMSPQERAIMREQIKKADGVTAPGGMPGISADGIVDAMWQTVRGMHAALYGEALPNAVKKDLHAPVPGFRRGSPLSLRAQLERGAWASETILAAVEASVRADAWDGVVAWGGTVKYHCIWHLFEAEETPGAACFWVLNTPEVLQWAEFTTGVARPWHGMYRMARPPGSASILTDAAIDALNAMRHKAAERRRIGAMVGSAGRLG